MRALGAADIGFLAAEKRATPMHVGALMLFDTPPGVPRDYLRTMYEQALELDAWRFPLDHKLAYPPSRLGIPHWVHDAEFDPGYHLRHSALPEPGRYRELFSLVSRLHGIMLDRDRPLWECHIIEQLQSGQFAMYMKVHHSVIDGVGAMKILQSSLSEDPNKLGMPFPYAAEADTTGAAHAPLRDDRARLERLTDAVTQLGAVPHVGRALVSAVLSGNRPLDTRLALPFEAPRSPLNTSVTSARRFVAQSYSLERIRSVGKSYDATLNDIVLAMCGSALRRYLGEFHGGAPDKPLIAAVPVSVRPSDADTFGNALAVVLANLGTHLSDPVARLGVIQASMNEAKSVLGELTYGEASAFSAMLAAPALAPALLGFGDMLPAVNVVISNVPGPRQPLYWNGARLAGMYPVSILFHGMALNITMVSNADKLDFGIVACRRALPSVQRMIDFLEEGLAELEGAV